MQELAWEMYTTQRLTIPFSEFPELVTKHFGLKNNPEQAAFFERDVRTQSYLVRDDFGSYCFAHKSFMEYFVACKMISTVYRPNFDVEEAIDTWGTRPLIPEIRYFLVGMLRDLMPLRAIVEGTYGRAFEEVKYAGGNAATLIRLREQLE